MEEKKIRIVYMGTPEFAVAPLKALLDAGFNVVGVITVPDKPAGRGQKLQESAVKQFAVSKGLKILQPVKLKDEAFLNELRSLKADLQFVVAFRMLPDAVWQMPGMGTVNLHASLLPQYRGAAPINHAIIQGETLTGITSFFIEKEIDTGKILFKEEVIIENTDNAGTLHDKLMYKGAELIIKTVNAIIDKKFTEIPQNTLFKNPESLKAAPKIFKDDCIIDWTKTGESVYNFIRGLSPYPVAWTRITDQNENEKVLRIFETALEPAKHNLQPKALLTDNKSFMKVAVVGGYINLLSIQMEGKKRMDAASFLNGASIKTII